ncbi:hypothetical protein LCGC14_0844220, partial [marine sediment metagenome]
AVENKVKKVILTRLEELPVKQKMKYGLNGKAVIEVSKSSPMSKEFIKIDGNYSDYFEEKFKGGGLKPEEIRDLGKGF